MSNVVYLPVVPKRQCYNVSMVFQCTYDRYCAYMHTRSKVFPKFTSFASKWIKKHPGSVRETWLERHHIAIQFYDGSQIHFAYTDPNLPGVDGIVYSDQELRDMKAERLRVKDANL